MVIKKTTIATFLNGDYAGQYDWQGGIPVSVGEVIELTLNNKKLVYKLTNKKIELVVDGGEQLVTINYLFETSE